MRSDLRLRRYRRGREELSGDGDPDLFGMASEEEARKVLTPSWLAGDRAEVVARALPLVQGGYYLLTGLWPLAHITSFERVTGRKTDKWLVRTVGALAAAIGGGLLQAGRKGHLPRDLRTVARLAAVGFVAVEVPTALRGRISPIYLADALVELGFIGAHAWAARELAGAGDELDALVRREARFG
ncbi:MAG TPA: hypothetical protein VF168_00090 [Trueperaceae bacterium]